MSDYLTIANHTRAAIDTRWLARHLRRVLKELKIAHAAWSITIVGDKEMTALHQRTMNLPTTTDVLTFDLRDKVQIRGTEEGADVELDTVICRDEALRRAKELRHAPLHELLLYCIHSLLHVQGHDDLKKSAAARMHRREDEILTAIGIGAVYTPEQKS